MHHHCCLAALDFAAEFPLVCVFTAFNAIRVCLSWHLEHDHILPFCVPLMMGDGAFSWGHPGRQPKWRRT